MASPADIITYIGVPLAVLGISPILYNFVIAFFIRLGLQRQLKGLGLLQDTIIQSRFINGVVELELPVYDLYMHGCPNVRACLRRNCEGVASVEGLQGGSWTKFEYCDNPREGETSRFRELAGGVTKGFQISSKLSLPESSIWFKDLLGHCVQIDRVTDAIFDPLGFKALK
jgi:hypothetical protein